MSMRLRLRLRLPPAASAVQAHPVVDRKKEVVSSGPLV